MEHAPSYMKGKERLYDRAITIKYSKMAIGDYSSELPQR